MDPRHGSLCFIEIELTVHYRRLAVWPRVFDLPTDWVYPRLRQALRGGIYQKVSTVGQRGIGREPPAASEIGSRPPRKSNQNSCQRICRTEEETKAPNFPIADACLNWTHASLEWYRSSRDLLPCSLVMSGTRCPQNHPVTSLPQESGNCFRHRP